MSEQPKQPKEKKEKPAKAPTGGSGVKVSDLQAPEFWKDRREIFEKLYAAQCEEYKRRAKDIKVTLLDGKVVPAVAWATTPVEIAKQLSNSLPDKVIVAKVNDVLWDLTRPLEEDCQLELLDWESADAKKVFWHSSAHVLGHALEQALQCKLSVGPPLDDGGFFYEGDVGRPITESDYPLIESCVQEVVKAKAPFQRLAIAKEDAVRMFGYNFFKSSILSSKVPEGATCTVYRCGELIDPCRGPHLPDTGRVKSFTVTKNSSSYFQGKADQASLQRVYAISFPKEQMLKEWKALMEEAQKRDHRLIGRQQELWMWHELSPGSTFFFQHGARIYNTMIEFQRRQYRRRGFEEVISPNIYNSKLWKISGHYDKYKENLFFTTVEHEEFALKPMNCPGHCLMFDMRPRSYRELPVRFADFGVLHRNEISGALSGLIRVRRFQQDDAHIFCTGEQVGTEMKAALHFLKDVYDILGFTFTLALSTRPENYIGDIKVWDQAEARLQAALNEFCGIPDSLPDPFGPAGSTFVFDGTELAQKKVKRLVAEKKYEGLPRSWELHPQDGAFYGPKIDVCVMDALHRKHQCGTIQLDFQLPLRFNLSYITQHAGSAEEGSEAAPPKKEDKKEKQEAKKEDKPAAPPVAPPAAPPVAPPTTAPGAPPPPHDASHKGCGCHDALPVNYSLEKPLDANQARPIMIHRAIFGSLERCIAILTEHYGGKWPFWLSPRQMVVVPVSIANYEYAREVHCFFGADFYCDVDLSDAKMEKKIRNNQLAQYNFILVVGAEECANRTVNVRSRDNVRHGTKSLDEMHGIFTLLRASFDKAEIPALQHGTPAEPSKAEKE
eukprot:PhF_6_TR43126/c1_g1_i1/m.65959/K01868/TARS, thrS; threonyl-tRNA synthetase